MCYVFIDAVLTAVEARERCSALHSGARLATFKTVAEAEAVNKSLSK